jgi:enoyl-CoA hydratase/carnithine racemase
MADLISVQTTGYVAVVEMHRPPNNFFDEALLASLAEALRVLDEDRARTSGSPPRSRGSRPTSRGSAFITGSGCR